MNASTAPPVAPVARRKPSSVTDAELLAALEDHGWRLGPTATALGISRPSLYTLMERSDRVRMAKDLSAEEIAQARDTCGSDIAEMSIALKVSAPGLKRRIKELGLS